MSPERVTLPVNRRPLRGRSAGAWQMHLRVLALWAAGSVAVLVSTAAPRVAVLALRVRPTTQARCYPSLPLQEQPRAWLCCPVLPVRSVAPAHRQLPQARSVAASPTSPRARALPAEPVAVRSQAAESPVYRKQRRVPASCPAQLKRFAAQILWVLTRRLVAQRCLGSPSLQEMLAQVRNPAERACCCRAQA